ncbi:MAG TPA: calcium-binding protein [Nitrospira sp.]|nr:calcium-binding protein [Nitrospira sp.]
MANIIGTNSNNTLNGTASADTLIGRAGNDTLNGSGGNDRLNGGVGTDILNGSTGIDTADYSNLVINGTTYTGATAGVTVNLGLTSAQNTGGAGTDTLKSIENLIGTSFADRLTGNSGNNVLSGLAGNDTLLGGGGNDRLNGGAGDDRLDGGTGNDTADYSTATAGIQARLGLIFSQDTVGAGVDTFASIEDLIGSNFADRLGGDQGNNRLTGLGGNDVILAGDGDDTLNGGDGIDQLFGDYGSDTLAGGSGLDHLEGWEGDDRLDGGTGADVMYGGNGDDTYVVDHVGDVAAEVIGVVSYDGVDEVQSSVTHTLGFEIEYLTLTGTAAINGTGNELNNRMIGNAANNVLTGLGGDDFIDGGAGADRMVGGDGNDKYIVDQVGDVVVEARDDAAGGIDRVQSSVSYTLGFEIEDLYLAGTAAINGTGNTKSNVLVGNTTNNVLSGLDGSDFIFGYEGNDQLSGGNGDDRLNGGNGNDSLGGALGADLLSGGLGNDKFIYKKISDSPSGTDLDAILDFTGNDAGIGDVIDLKSLDTNIELAGNQDFTYIGSTAFTAAGQLRYAGGLLQGNTDADAAAEFEIELVGAPALTVGGAGTDILL